MVRVRPGGDGRGFRSRGGRGLIADRCQQGFKDEFAVITLPYSVDTHKGAAAGPDALLQAGLADWLREEGHDVVGPVHVKLTPGEEAAYGAWNKIGFANAHLARLVSEAAKEQAFPLLLEGNCYGAIGALAGYKCLPTRRLHGSV
jgi:arginase family enzyme